MTQRKRTRSIQGNAGPFRAGRRDTRPSYPWRSSWRHQALAGQCSKKQLATNQRMVAQLALRASASSVRSCLAGCSQLAKPPPAQLAARSVHGWVDESSHKKKKTPVSNAADCAARCAARSMKTTDYSYAEASSSTNCGAHASLRSTPEKYRKHDQVVGGRRVPKVIALWNKKGSRPARSAGQYSPQRETE